LGESGVIKVLKDKIENIDKKYRRAEIVLGLLERNRSVYFARFVNGNRRIGK